jgi:aryl-alcohol dehydrogenase-like predicted oxidoreductase
MAPAQAVDWLSQPQDFWHRDTGTEAIIGTYLSHSPGKRQQLVVATKFFGSMESGNPNAGDTGRKNIIWACE